MAADWRSGDGGEGMQARDLIELAALVATHGPSVMTGASRIPAAGVEEYWIASKSRLDRWGRLLKEFREQTPELDSFTQGRRWAKTRPLIEEIFVSEPLARVWGAVVAGYDRAHGQDQFEPLAWSVVLGHQEARNRALNLLASGVGVAGRDAVSLNRLRRRVERWSDLLVARLAQVADVAHFAVNSERALDFAQDFREQQGTAAGVNAWKLTIAALRAAFGQELSQVSPNGDLNDRIAAAVTASFQPELFDATGPFRSLWLARLMNNTLDAQAMVADLLADGAR